MALFDPSIFEAQRRRLLDAYAQQSALNAYQRAIGTGSAQRGITELGERAFRTTASGGLGEVPKLSANYGRRGLQGMGIKSGVYQNALQNYAARRARETGYAQEDLANIGRGYEITGRGYQADLEANLRDLEANKARQIAEDARALLNLR